MASPATRTWKHEKRHRNKNPFSDIESPNERMKRTTQHRMSRLCVSVCSVYIYLYVCMRLWERQIGDNFESWMLASQPTIQVQSKAKKIIRKIRRRRNKYKNTLRFDSKMLFTMAISISTMSTNTRTRAHLIVFVSSHRARSLFLSLGGHYLDIKIVMHDYKQREIAKRNKLINKYAIVVCDLCPKFTNKNSIEAIHIHSHTKAHLNHQRSRREKTIAKIKPKQIESNQNTTNTRRRVVVKSSKHVFSFKLIYSWEINEYIQSTFNV